MKAVVADKKFGSAIVVDREPPRLRQNGYMLVRTAALALNPIDPKILEYGMAEANCLLCCDYAGVVEEVSSDVQRSFKVGDRVCGAARPGDPYEIENGAGAEIVCVKADLALHIPDWMSFEEASTFGVTQLTTGRCFYQKFGLPWPNNPDPKPGQLFVSGGSSAMGTMVTQWAKLSGFEVITTSSPRNFDLCKSYGADHVLDYSNPAAPEQIRVLGRDSLTLCVDCISTPESAAFCAKVLASGGKYSAITPVKCPREDIETFHTLGYSFLNEEWEQFGRMNPASPEDFEYSKGFAVLAEQYLAEKKMRSHPVELRDGGLEAVPKLFEDLVKVSGKKIVVRVGSP